METEVVVPTRAGDRAVRLVPAGAVVAVVAGALLLGGSALGVGPTRSPAPSPNQARVETFARPFAYTPLNDDVLVPEGTSRSEVFAWIHPPVTELTLTNSVPPVGGQAYGSYGIAIASAEHAWTHACTPPNDLTGRATVRSTPAEFLADLRAIGGVGLGTEMPSTLDGRPAIEVDLDPGTGCGSDVHLSGPMTGLALGPFLRLTLPSRFVVADIDGETVFVQIWARTPARLAAWLPDAMRFVEGIDFVAE